MVKDSIFNGKKCFLHKTRVQGGISALITSVQPRSRGSSNAVRQEKGIRSTHIGKKKVKLSLFTDSIIYRETSWNRTKSY